MKINGRKYRLKKKVKIVLFIIIFLITALILGLYIQYRLSNTYKFKELGYNKEQVKYLVNFDETFQNKLLKLDYDPDLIKLLKQKYFIQNNFNKYLNYLDSHKKVTIKQTVALVNVGRDREYYTKAKKTDTSKKELMLVNKYNYLTKDYVPKDVKEVSIQYAYDDRSAADKPYQEYKKMADAAKKEKISLVINSAYRSYDSQKSVYDEYESRFGEDYANDYAAHPGYSEHQTGYAFDIGKLGVALEDFEKTEEFKWLKQNAYKYGFILRYPKGKEEITGFKYESWHYRYVGKEVAKKITKEKITFDEYYAYYVDKK